MTNTKTLEKIIRAQRELTEAVKSIIEAEMPQAEKRPILRLVITDIGAELHPESANIGLGHGHDLFDDIEL